MTGTQSFRYYFPMRYIFAKYSATAYQKDATGNPLRTLLKATGDLRPLQLLYRVLHKNGVGDICIYMTSKTVPLVCRQEQPHICRASPPSTTQHPAVNESGRLDNLVLLCP